MGKFREILTNISDEIFTESESKTVESVATS